MLKRFQLSILLLLYLLTTSSSLLQADAHIFVYHRFGDTRHPSTNTSIAELRKEFNYFKKNGYKVVKLETLINALKEDREIPDNWIVLTIDDNFKSFYTKGLPIFKEFGYPFTIFLYLKATQEGYKDYTSFDQLRKIAKYGSFEYHSYAHAHMVNMSEKEIREDFDKGLAIFEKEFGIKPKYFVYPYGEYNEQLERITKEYGFEAVLNQNMGAVSKGTDIFDIDRCALVGKPKLKTYLNFDELHNVEIVEPTSYPKNGILTRVKAKVENSAKKAFVYIRGHGWRPVKVKDGIIDYKTSKKIKGKRMKIGIQVGTKLKVKVFMGE
ncbi:polysaccharide deacetylase family protein [Sulfurovum sp. bin170]|uniref:polysaccharide deacetylase family protein n=1 Tax=Sulfurovum sp. bin170 TaxID=2695268 RepID=UPI0013DEBFAA|nr:polysaccharide deacetylase family protein [Sulfurovum sp. bin170]NEW60402.1 polysaccharide deacetylase family protein [Sulfurovum sp. bin170]